jgi:ABC-type glycerol-3-phosphate transport system permease component
MKKGLRRLLIIVLVIAGLLAASFPLFRMYTKSFSPEETVTYNEEELKIEVTYCRPAKKDRVIFGELVPYGEVWRTGANEATIFETNQNLTIQNKTLPSGKYTLWTKPGKDSWEIYFNSKMYPWGLSIETGKAAREAEYDVLTATVIPAQLDETVELFTIEFQQAEVPNMVLKWDKTKVSLPIE